jgi:plastocyanin domain-containing protein
MNRLTRSPRVLLAVSFAAFLTISAGCAGQKLAPGEVAIEVTDEGFVPATVTVPKGKPATLVFTRKVDGTCATSVVFTASGEKHDLPLKQAVRVTLPAERPDTLDYACGMNMLSGEVVSK